MPNWMHWRKDDFTVGGKDCMVCVDGKQRVEAVRKFYRNELPVFGHTFNEYEDPRHIRNISLDIYINDLNTKKEVLQWYLDLNTGGIVHTDEEIAKVKALIEMEK